ncbi:MAG: cupin domain-containing protein, partial [Desulfatitalea sp.]|nr:cupin domain-containing protein [Desulfatitalea sp.]
RGRVYVGDHPPCPVVPGDVVRIDADTPQRIENTGAQDLVFYAVCAPRFQSQCYFGLE